MKFVISVCLMALLTFTIGLFTFLPWYSFVIVVGIVATAIHQKPLTSFLSGFLALFILWIVLSLLKDIPNNHILSTKVAQILPLNGSYLLLTFITGLIGGLIGGFGALTGSYLRKL